MDYGTRLPPRKRLLAGMKRQNCTEPSLRFHSDELRARVREVLESSYASAEEFVEASNSVAFWAEKAAAEARAEAMEKAESAARAKALAKSILEAVVYGSGVKKPPAPGRGRKKRVAVDIVYTKAEPFGGSCENDEEMARSLHQFMNSSPRWKEGKKLGNAAKRKRLDREGANGGGYVNHLVSSGKENKGVAAKSLASLLRGDGDTVQAGKKAKSKKKRILLSQFCSTGPGNSRPAQDIADRSFSGEIKAKDEAGNSSSNAANTSEENESMWKRKKLKLSQFYPEGKILTPLRSKQEATAASSSS